MTEKLGNWFFKGIMTFLSLLFLVLLTMAFTQFWVGRDNKQILKSTEEIAAKFK